MEEQAPGFVTPERPRSYYFHDSESNEEQISRSQVAVSGQDVVARSKSAWPGCAMPWRVAVVDASGRHISRLSSHDVVDNVNSAQQKRRRRAGKKRRIAIRTKLAAAKAVMAEAQKEAVEKEAAEREKRTRRNREKKIKKKERDKTKKAAVAEAASESALAP